MESSAFWNASDTVLARVLATLLLFPLTTLPLQAKEPKAAELKLITGLDVSSGDYGDDTDTDILYVPFTIVYDRSPIKLKLTIPWLEIDGPGNVIGGGDSVIVVPGAGGAKTKTESGMGDVVAGFTYELAPLTPARIFVDLTAKVKIPTADEDKRLGTGETDYRLQADFFKSMGKLTPLATLGYKIKGDTDTTNFDNVLYASAGLAYKFNPPLQRWADFRL